MVKGIREYAGKEAARLRAVAEAVRKWFRCYGFQELVTGCIAARETLESEIGRPGEIISDIFKLQDKAGRQLGLRYELTATLAQFLKQQQVKLPFKRFEIGNVWRDEPTQPGRYREFLQADADIVGSSSILADVECLLLARDIFRELGIAIEIRINNRKLLEGILDAAGIAAKQQLRDKIMAELDKLDKKCEKEVQREIAKAAGEKATEKLFNLLKKSLEQLKKLNEKTAQGAVELEQLLALTKAKFYPILARGLAYYTGNVFEIYSTKFRFALAAGGRYDRKIVLQGRYMPAVGISFGLNRIAEIAQVKEEPFASCMIIPISEGERKAALQLAENLRNSGIKTDLAYEGITKALDYANSLKIPYVIFLGKQELSKKKVKLRDMTSGKEQLLSKKQVIAKLAAQAKSSC